MIGENLLTLRRRARLSQARVAEAVGVSRQAVAKWESGETTPDIANCAALARLYDVTIDDLVRHDDAQALGVPIAPRGKWMFGAVTVGDKGQIVIPAKARRVFGIAPGDELVVLGDIEQGLALVKADDLLNMIAAMRAPQE